MALILALSRLPSGCARQSGKALLARHDRRSGARETRLGGKTRLSSAAAISAGDVSLVAASLDMLVYCLGAAIRPLGFPSAAKNADACTR